MCVRAYVCMCVWVGVDAPEFRLGRGRRYQLVDVYHELGVEGIVSASTTGAVVLADADTRDIDGAPLDGTECVPNEGGPSVGPKAPPQKRVRSAGCVRARVWGPLPPFPPPMPRAQPVDTVVLVTLTALWACESPLQPVVSYHSHPISPVVSWCAGGVLCGRLNAMCGRPSICLACVAA